MNTSAHTAFAGLIAGFTGKREEVLILASGANYLGWGDSALSFDKAVVDGGLAADALLVDFGGGDGQLGVLAPGAVPVVLVGSVGAAVCSHFVHLPSVHPLRIS